MDEMIQNSPLTNSFTISPVAGTPVAPKGATPFGQLPATYRAPAWRAGRCRFTEGSPSSKDGIKVHELQWAMTVRRRIL